MKSACDGVMEYKMMVFCSPRQTFFEGTEYEFIREKNSSSLLLALGQLEVQNVFALRNVSGGLRVLSILMT